MIQQLRRIVVYIAERLENRQYTAGAFIDFSPAIDKFGVMDYFLNSETYYPIYITTFYIHSSNNSILKSNVIMNIRVYMKQALVYQKDQSSLQFCTTSTYMAYLLHRNKTLSTYADVTTIHGMSLNSSQATLVVQEHLNTI